MGQPDQAGQGCALQGGTHLVGGLQSAAEL
jgi:hypothetical protein